MLYSYDKDITFKMNQPFFREGVFDYRETEMQLPYQTVFYEFISGYSSNSLSCVPCGCMDICFITGISRPLMQIIGASTEYRTVKCIPGAHYFGVRLKPGMYINTPGAALHDIANSELWISSENSFVRSAFSQIKKCASFEQRMDTFLDRMSPGTESGQCGEITQHMLCAINSFKGNLHIGDLAEEMSYSERHISRIFQESMGMTPKTFSRIVRFQNALDSMLFSRRQPISDYISDLGYSDQAHFQREFKQYTGMTPKGFIQFFSHY